MPHIIVTADRADDHEDAVMLRERVTVADFESGHFATQLVERLGWAVEDAAAEERASVLGIAGDAVETTLDFVSEPADDIVERDEALESDRADRQYATAGVTHDE